MEEQDPASTAEDESSGPRTTLSALSLAARRDSRRRSLGANFMISAAQTAILSGSRVVTKRTSESVRRTTESVALTRTLMAAKRCHDCKRQFGAEVGKKRHCRRCGEIFCYECCSERAHLTIYHSRWGILKNRTSKSLYVCKQCFFTVRATLPEPAKAPRQRTLTEDEVAQMNPESPERLEGSDGRGRAGSLLTRVRKTRARTLDKYMEAVKIIREEEGGENGPTSPRRPSVTPTDRVPGSPGRRESKHRRRNTLDDGFRYRLQAKNQQEPVERSLSRAKELRDIFFDGVSRIELEPSPAPNATDTSHPVLLALSLDDLNKVHRKSQQQHQVAPPPPPTPTSTWGSFFSNLWRFTPGGATSPTSPTGSHSTTIDHEFDKAFEQEEIALEEALQQSQEQLRQHEKNLKESEKQLEKARTEQVKRMTAKLLELQENKIKDAVQQGAVVEKQMMQHAKYLETEIKNGRLFDDTNEHDVVDLRDELRSVYMHMDELNVETVFPQCMRWKLRSKVEEGLFVGVRDFDIEKLDCNFSIKTSGMQKRVLLHMYQINASVAMYEFVIRGNSAKAKVLSRALAPTLNRVEIQLTGEWYLPLMFQEGGTPEQPASRWIPEKDKCSYHLHIAKTVENSSILHLPDSFLQWLVNSLIPSLIEATVISALPTRDLGWFLCESRNEVLIRGKFQVHGDITPRVWKAPLVGPTNASIAARRALCVTEEEAAVLDFLLRSHLASVSGFPANRAVSLSIMHTWRLQFASHSLAALAPLLAVVESGSRMKIPANWTLQLLRRVDELAAKAVNLQIQLFDVELDLDVKEMLTTITGLYLKSVEDTVAKEIELEAARKAKRNRRVSDVMYSSEVQETRNPEDALRMAREAVARIHKHFDRSLIPMLRDQAKTQFNVMLAGGSGGILAFSFTNFLADICLPKKFQFATLLWESPEVYEGFVLKVNGKNGPGDGEYTMKFNVLPVGEEIQDDSDSSSDEEDEKNGRRPSSTSAKKHSKEENDAETTLKNAKIELFPVGRPPGAVHVAIEAWRSSLLLNSLVRAVLSSAGQPSAPPIDQDLRHDALKEERRVRRNSHAQTEQTRDLLRQSRQVVENLWGSFRVMPNVPEEQVKRDVIELAGGIDPLAVHFISNNNSSTDSDDEQYTQKLLMPYLTNDAFALHIDVRGLELALKKVKSTSGAGDSMRLVLVKSMRHERDSQCVSFSMRRNLQDVFQADLLPI